MTRKDIWRSLVARLRRPLFHIEGALLAPAARGKRPDRMHGRGLIVGVAEKMVIRIGSTWPVLMVCITPLWMC